MWFPSQSVLNVFKSQALHLHDCDFNFWKIEEYYFDKIEDTL